jgi:hypothetical protein
MSNTDTNRSSIRKCYLSSTSTTCQGNGTRKQNSWIYRYAAFHSSAHWNTISTAAISLLPNNGFCLLNAFTFSPCFWRITAIYLHHSNEKQIMHVLNCSGTKLKFALPPYLELLTYKISYAVFIYVYVLCPYQTSDIHLQCFVKKEYGGEKSIAPHFLSLTTKWMCVISLRLRPFHHRERRPQLPLTRKLGQPHGQPRGFRA